MTEKWKEYRVSGYFKNAAGMQNHYLAYLLPDANAEIVVSHGFCEFAEKYEEVVEEFLEKGYSIYIPEHRGHGYSYRECDDLEKVHIDAYEDYVEDLYWFIEQKILLKRKKLILFAHSMGGAVGALFLEQHPGIFDAAIFSSPMFGMQTGKFPTIVARVAAEINCLMKKNKKFAAGQSGFDGISDFAHSSCLSEESYQRIFQLRVDNQRYQTYGSTYGWVRASIRATDKLMKPRNLRKIKIPTLIFQAGKEHMVVNKEQLKFFLRTEKSSLMLMPDAKHEIFHAKEETRERYYAQIFEYLTEICEGNTKELWKEMIEVPNESHQPQKEGSSWSIQPQ